MFSLELGLDPFHETRVQGNCFPGNGFWKWGLDPFDKKVICGSRHGGYLFKSELGYFPKVGLWTFLKNRDPFPKHPVVVAAGGHSAAGAGRRPPGAGRSARRGAPPLT